MIYFIIHNASLECTKSCASQMLNLSETISTTVIQTNIHTNIYYTLTLLIYQTYILCIYY